MELLVTSQALIDHTEELDGLDIDFTNLIGVVTTQKPADILKRFQVVLSRPVAVSDFETFAGMGIVQGNFPGRQTVFEQVPGPGELAAADRKDCQQGRLEKSPAAPARIKNQHFLHLFTD